MLACLTYRLAIRLAFVTALVATPAAGVASAADLISDSLARQQGLQRAWFSQVQLNPSRNEVENVTLAGNQLIALTSAGIVQAFNAETGQVEWTTRIGNPNYPSLGPAVGPDHIAMINGSVLHVLDRRTGREVLSKRTTGGPGAGPAIADGYVYVPLFNGRVEAFPIEGKAKIPWYYSSAGRIFTPAVSASTSVVWSTDRAYLYVAAGGAGGVRYRFESDSRIAAPATAHAPNIYFGTEAGYVFALDEDSGNQRWRYAAGASVTHSPVAVGKDQLYVATEEPALHCIDPVTGESRWITTGVVQFIAASKNRVYGADRFGGLVVIDQATGVTRSKVASPGNYQAVLNDQTDRLYIFTTGGLIQCFHEIGADKPYLHHEAEDKADTMDAKKDDATKDQVADDMQKEDGESADEPAAADPFATVDPFAPAEEPAEEAPADDPFGGSDDPFGGGDDDPFK